MASACSNRAAMSRSFASSAFDFCLGRFTWPTRHPRHVGTGSSVQIETSTLPQNFQRTEIILPAGLFSRAGRFSSGTRSQGIFRAAVIPGGRLVAGCRRYPALASAMNGTRPLGCLRKTKNVRFQNLWPSVCRTSASCAVRPPAASPASHRPIQRAPDKTCRYLGSVPRTHQPVHDTQSFYR